MRKVVAWFTKLSAALVLLASCSKVDCEACKKQCVDCQPPAGGSIGIPYAACTKADNQADPKCSTTALRVVDPQSDLVDSNGFCFNHLCRATYASGKYCLDNDQTVCGFGDGTTGHTTCSGGTWGTCQPGAPTQ
jgi:hypothetical protein